MAIRVWEYYSAKRNKREIQRLILVQPWVNYSFFFFYAEIHLQLFVMLYVVLAGIEHQNNFWDFKGTLVASGCIKIGRRS